MHLLSYICFYSYIYSWIHYIFYAFQSKLVLGKLVTEMWSKASHSTHLFLAYHRYYAPRLIVYQINSLFVSGWVLDSESYPTSIVKLSYLQYSAVGFWAFHAPSQRYHAFKIGLILRFTPGASILPWILSY